MANYYTSHVALKLEDVLEAHRQGANLQVFARLEVFF